MDNVQISDKSDLVFTCMETFPSDIVADATDTEANMEECVVTESHDKEQRRFPHARASDFILVYAREFIVGKLNMLNLAIFDSFADMRANPPHFRTRASAPGVFPIFGKIHFIHTAWWFFFGIAFSDQRRNRSIHYPKQIEDETPFTTMKEAIEFLRNKGCRPEQGGSHDDMIYYRCQGLSSEDEITERCPVRWRINCLEDGTFQLWTNDHTHTHPLTEQGVCLSPRWACDKDNLLGSFKDEGELQEALSSLSRNTCFTLAKKQNYDGKDDKKSEYYECSKGVHRVAKTNPKGPNYRASLRAIPPY
eukprot:Nk52_evm58s621 gene=Nk52_evmTU58s621